MTSHLWPFRAIGARAPAKQPKNGRRCPIGTTARLLSISIIFQILVRDDYFFSIVFSNINPDAINTAKTNTIVFIFLPFL